MVFVVLLCAFGLGALWWYGVLVVGWDGLPVGLVDLFGLAVG